jgi:hypothetical protein
LCLRKILQKPKQEKYLLPPSPDIATFRAIPTASSQRTEFVKITKTV